MKNELAANYDSQLVNDGFIQTQTVSESTKLLRGAADLVTSSQRSYESDVRIFNLWCAENLSASHLPNVIDLINFISDQYQGKFTELDLKAGKLNHGRQIAISTLQRRKSFILKYLAVLYESKGLIFTPPVSHMIELRKTFKSLKNLPPQKNPYNEKMRGARYPLRSGDIKHIMTYLFNLEHKSFGVIRDRALIAFLYVSGARESEIVGKRGIRICDLELQDDHIDYVRARLKIGSAQRDFPGRINQGSSAATCPVKAVTDYLNTLKSFYPTHVNRDSEMPLFLRVNRNKMPFSDPKALNEDSVDDILVRLCKESKLFEDEPHKLNKIAGHSSRIGCIIELTETGSNHGDIQAVTGQSLNTITGYQKQRIIRGNSGNL